MSKSTFKVHYCGGKASVAEKPFLWRQLEPLTRYVQEPLLKSIEKYKRKKKYSRPLLKKRRKNELNEYNSYSDGLPVKSIKKITKKEEAILAFLLSEKNAKINEQNRYSGCPLTATKKCKKEKSYICCVFETSCVSLEKLLVFQRITLHAHLMLYFQS